jgi:glucokinase
MMNHSAQPSRTRPETAPNGLWIGLDVGGTKINAVAAGEDGQVHARARIPTDASSGAAAVESIAQAVRSVLAAAGAGEGAVRAIGLGIPGQVQGGEVRMAVHLKLESFQLAGWLSDQFSVPVTLENDVRAVALGAYEWLIERCQRENQPAPGSMVYLSIGTGISAGVVLNGRLHRGVSGMAGEVGHAVIDPHGVVCKCGMRGCLETFVAGWGIARQAGEMLAAAQHSGQPTLLAQAAPLTAERVYACAAQGDPLALALAEQVGRYASRAIDNLFVSYDVDCLVVGGGVACAGEVFFAPVRAELERMADESPLARAMVGPPGKVILLPPGADPVERGVLALARQGS